MKKALALLLSIGMSAALLTGCGGGGKTGSTPSAENTYLILVQDADDASPLSGVTVQFCSDTECMVNRTDENGSAAFEAEPGNYTAHVLKVPAGYKANEELYATPNTYSDLVIVVETE